MKRLIVVAGLCVLAGLDRAGRDAIGAALVAFVTIAALLALGALADAEGLFERRAARVGRLAGVRPSVATFSTLGAVTTVPALVLAFLGLRGLGS